MTVLPEVSQEEESFVGESRQGQPSIVDLMEEIERLKGQVASLKSKARERPLPEGQEDQGSQTGNPMVTGSDQGKGRKAASTGRDVESPTAADACGAGRPPQPPTTAGKRK